MSTNLIQLQDPSDVIADASTNPALQSWGYSVSQPLPGDLGTAQNPVFIQPAVSGPGMIEGEALGVELGRGCPVLGAAAYFAYKGLYVGIFAALLILIAVGGKR